MPVNNCLYINNVQVNIDDLIFNNYGTPPNFKKFKNEYFPVKDSSTITWIPVNLLNSLLGFNLRWSDDFDNMNTFYLKRENTEFKFSIGSRKVVVNGKDYMMSFPIKEDSEETIFIPSEIFRDMCNINFQWLDNSTFSIKDPLTLPFYEILTQKYSINTVNKIFVYDLNGDGEKELYVAYYDDLKLSLAAFTSKGLWLYDNFISGQYIIEFDTIEAENQKLLVVTRFDLNYEKVIDFYKLKDNRLIFLYSFYSPHFCTIKNNKIHATFELFDTAEHGIKYAYQWNNNHNKLEEIGKEVIYIYGKNMVNRKNPEQVATAFTEAIALGLEEEALSYCSERLKVAFPGENFKYSIKDNRINLWHIIEHFENYPLKNNANDLKIKVLASCDDRIVILAYYDTPEAEDYNEPNHIIRLVLEKIEEEFKIIFINYLFNTPPTNLYYQSEIDLEPVFPVCSLFTCYQLKTEAKINFWLEYWYKDIYKLTKCHVDNCSNMQIQEMFPGIKIAFFRDDGFRRCFFMFPNAADVNILKEDKGYIIIRVVCLEILN